MLFRKKFNQFMNHEKYFNKIYFPTVTKLNYFLYTKHFTISTYKILDQLKFLGMWTSKN